MNTRNFAIIAHIDHGKSTLADRIMEFCGAVDKGHPDQLLDSLELEREHGITIKLKAIRLKYRSKGQECVFNLIDTPGHVDFYYEVSRSLASVEGVVLVVDATQGVQAQTLANFNLALEAGLTIIPVINKIDMPQADIENSKKQLTDLGFTLQEIILVSAKTGENVDLLLEEIVRKIPLPKNLEKFAGLIFDSSLDPYKGVVATIRSFGGSLRVGDDVTFLATHSKAEVLQIGYLSPKPVFTNELLAGEIGFVVTSLKDLVKVRVGDTLIRSNDPTPALPGYKQVKPVVFLSFFPTDPQDFPKLKDSLEKLQLNDSALSFTTESSLSLGQGLRLGFLGLLHAQITQERLEKEYDMDIIAASPSVNFIVDGQQINKPSEFNSQSKEVMEPYAKVIIFTPPRYLGIISDLIYSKRGTQQNLETVSDSLKITARMPFVEIITGFYDQLKSQTSGFASFDFEISDYQKADLVKLEILINHQSIEGLAQIIPASSVEELGRRLVEKLKEVMPRQQIVVPIQATVGGKIIARETVPAYRKDVTAKLYGGDVTRKMKLLEKQKKGKKRMRQFGSISIPQEAFMAILRI